MQFLIAMAAVVALMMWLSWLQQRHYERQLAAQVERSRQETVRMRVFAQTALQVDALGAARHELVTLNGLIAADGAAPDETWTIDTRTVIAKLDAALNAPSCSDSGRA